MNPLRTLETVGQSVWLDSIRRSMVREGGLGRLVHDDGLRGVTSNPAIFEKAISGGSDYREAIAELAGDRSLDAKALYERLAVEDIRDAADVLASVYRESEGRDGFVSLEVSPHLARDTAATVDEARRLWRSVDRPNLMIKVPGTPEGIPAFETLIAEGINVNVTLLFSRAVYERVAEAYLSGLERRLAAGATIAGVASVASFFVSRIDTAVDGRLETRLAGADEATRRRVGELRGRVAIANAKLAYQHYRGLVASSRWQHLAARGARPQRLLWASTSTKNPVYRDVLYVEELIGEDTVNTMPPATFDAFRDHGVAKPTLAAGVAQARAVLVDLGAAGVDLESVTDELLDDGLRLFSEAFDRLLAAVEASRREADRDPLRGQHLELPPPLRARVQATLDELRQGEAVRRLWARDATLWTGRDEARWLGWLTAPGDQRADGERFRALAAEARSAGFTHILLLGMGGSSLCPDVLRATFDHQPDRPALLVLDSTDPAQVRAREADIDLARTLFIVSSKSGTTLEPTIFMAHFLARANEALGAREAGSRFVAITDPGSALERDARAHGFRHVFHGEPSIGGRYSALSDFGMVPAAFAGLDVDRLLERADAMARACGASVPVEENPGAVLGAVLGALGSGGRDKVTILTSPSVASLGAWLEQLLAESTGKQGKGLIPVAEERPGAPEAYGKDRIFAYLGVAGDDDRETEDALTRLEEAGQPVVRITLADRHDIAAEFFRWEIATAVAGAVLGIDPFDQPDVEASKVATRHLTEAYERAGALPAETPLLVEGELSFFTDAANARALVATTGGAPSSLALLRAHLSRLAAGDYFALLAYLEMNEVHHRKLQTIRHRVRDAKRVATCLGFGPRFLHSTGQAYKGGPGSGVYLQLTCDDRADLAIPGHGYTFGVVKAAQARGDLEVLAERGRRALRVHLGGDVEGGLERLDTLCAKALA
jgi:transaldolase/glucose-6-phosphate isomerase